MRVATFNILHGRSLTDGRVDLDRLRAAVRRLDADVLALQEVDRAQPRSHRADLTAVAAEAMGATDHRFAAALTGTPGGDWVTATGREDDDVPGYGVALLSRYRVQRWGVVRLPRAPVRFPMYFPGAGLGIFREEPRVAVVAELDTPHGPLAVANTHLSFVPGWNRRQLRRVQAGLARFDGPALLVGDLNLAPPVPARVTGFRPLADARTFPADAPSRQLDHVLLRGEFAAVRGNDAPRLELSDHRALVVEF